MCQKCGNAIPPALMDYGVCLACLETRDTCKQCGVKIPPLPVDYAYCVRCRLGAVKIRVFAPEATEYDVAVETVAAREQADQNAPPTAESEIDLARQETIARLVARLISGNAGERQITERVWGIAYLMRDRLKYADDIKPPMSLDALGSRLGVKKTRAWKIVKELEAELMK